MTFESASPETSTPPQKLSVPNKKVHLVGRKEFLHGSCNVLHVTITGEQDKRAAVSLLDKMGDPVFERFLITSVARIGNLLHNEHSHLPLKIERAAEL